MAAIDTTLANLGIGRTGQAAATPVVKANAALGQDDFLALMTAQMKNQDPFEPVDNTQMVAQMAQFSSLAGISEMNGTLQAIATKLGATSANDALGWVGRTVLVPGETAYPRTDGSLEGAVELDGAATDVSLTISNADGQVLRTVSLGAQAAGSVDFAWDGSTDSGESAGAGPFTIRVAATGSGGTVAARPLVWSPVNTVSIPSDGDPVLTLPGIGQLPVSAVRKIG